MRRKSRFTALFCVILSVCLLLGSAVSDTKVTVSPDEGGNGQDVTAVVDGGVTGTHTGESAHGITIDGSNPTDFLTIDGEDLYAQLASVDDPVSVSVTAESVSESTEGGRDAYGISVFADMLSADVTVDGDITAQAQNDGAFSRGVEVLSAEDREAAVEVGGNVTAGAKGGTLGDAIAIEAAANSGGKTTVTVGGNAAAVSESGSWQVSSFGIKGEATENGSALEITVGGDVSGRGTDGNGDAVGYGMNLKNETGAATNVVVGGTVAGDTAAVRLQITGQDADPDAISLTAWKVEENGEGKLVEAAGVFRDAEEQKKTETAFEERINYIVRVQDKVKNMLGVLGGGTVSLGGNTYATAVEDGDVALTVNLGTGVALDGVYYNAEDAKTLTKTDSLKQNSDGQYLVKMLRGGGMLLGLASHTHVPADAVQENRTEPTCETAGSYDKVTKCSICGKELSRETITLDKLPHTEETVEENRVEPTCEAEGSYDKVVRCSVCEKELSRETITLDKLPHTEETVEENRVEPTCEAEGSYDKVVRCSVCEKELSRETITLDKLPHTEETTEENRVEPTCTRAGSYEKVVKCSVCGEEISRETITLDKPGHTEETVEENRVEPTCTEAGSYEKVVKCSVCGEEISREKVTLPAAGHQPNSGYYNYKEPTDTEDGGYDVVSICSVCDEVVAVWHETLPKTGKSNTVDIPVTITWNDNNNADGNRPAEVTIRLYADGVEVNSAVVIPSVGTYTFTGMPVTDEDGNEIVYTVGEDAVAMYAVTVSGFTLAHEYIPEVTSVSVSVVWVDNNDEQGIRPNSIAMSLSDGQKVVKVVILDESNGWSATVTNLPTVVAGEKAVYAFKAQQVLSYTVEGVEQQGNHMTFTEKVWERPENPTAGRRPKTRGNTWYVFEDYDEPL